MPANLAFNRSKNSLSEDLYSTDLKLAILLPYYMNTSQMICLVNRLTGFYVIRTPASRKLTKSVSSQ